MRVLGEQDLRRLYFKGVTEIRLTGDVFVTRPARQYAHEKGIGFITEKKPSPQKKPEHMTHLSAEGGLVQKNHPRIVLRGKLDSLLSDVICAQVLAEKKRSVQLVEYLQQVADLIRQLIRCEVTGSELPAVTLFGMGLDEIQERSHYPEKYYGSGHAPPHYGGGELFAVLNRLRAYSREAEIAAVDAFCGEAAERNDILHTMNRLSSAFYILTRMEANGAAK